MSSRANFPAVDFSAHRIAPAGESIVVTANGLRQHALCYGDVHAPPIVVLPGITSPAITWEFVAQPLAQDHRVMVLDLRGRGYTDAASSYRMDDYANDVAAFIDVAGLQNPAILGHSMGARIAAAIATCHPSARGPLVVVDPPLTGPGRPAYPFPKEIYVDSVRKARAGMSIDDVRRVYPTWSARELAIRAEWLATCDEAAVSESYDRFHDEDFFSRWAACAPPVLFIYGAESPVVSAAGVHDIRAANRAAEVVAVAGAGHMIPWDNLEEFLAVVREFLGRNRTT
jgi:N-formylmaleamate deformylase